MKMEPILLDSILAPCSGVVVNLMRPCVVSCLGSGLPASSGHQFRIAASVLRHFLGGADAERVTRRQ